LLSENVMHRCSDFHVNSALQIFYDDDNDDDFEDDVVEGCCGPSV